MSFASLGEASIKITDQVEREEAARDSSLTIDNGEVDPPTVHLIPFQPRSDDVDNRERLAEHQQKIYLDGHSLGLTLMKTLPCSHYKSYSFSPVCPSR
jgi:hypothetical protein